MKQRSIAQLLAEAMATHGLTDTEAARRIGVSQPTLTRWRVGKAKPSEQHVAALALFCGSPATTIKKAIDNSENRQVKFVDGTLSQLLITLENERNLEAPELIAASGVDRSAYYRWRKGRGTPHLSDVPMLAAKLGITEERLVMAVYRSVLAYSR